MIISPSPHAPFAGQNGPVVLAHRGFRGQYPENTMPAFQKAADLGVHGLEMDIHRSRDGVLIVCHDATVDRTTDGSGLIKEMTLAELKRLDAGYRWTADDGHLADYGRPFPFRGRGITIPTLEEVFAAFPQFWINVDIKQSSPGIVRPFADLIRQYEMTDKMMVGSFDAETVSQFRRECPEVATAASEAEARRLFILSRLGLSRLYRGAALALQLPEWSDRHHVVTRRFVQAAHQRGTAVHVWTVNEIGDMERLLAIGVDGLITDYPDRLLKLIKAKI
ncbi:MAG: glycerophosphodiester phosphodiesterase [Chloroflexi bacterium]|nr:glycerophosphodiester phosphodiesterase [Chloroflexota bacterium]